MSEQALVPVDQRRVRFYADDQFDRVLAYLRAEFQRVTDGTAPQQDPLF